jgi:hypothetical protein
MSLLDYAGSQLGWHPDWPEARSSVWQELSRTRRPRLGCCGGGDEPPGIRRAASQHICHPCPASTTWRPRRQTSTTAADASGVLSQRKGCTAANALRYHIEAEPCAHYAVPALNQSAAGAEAKGSARARSTVALTLKVTNYTQLGVKIRLSMLLMV